MFILKTMSSPFLSPQEKLKGIKHHYRHQIYNGAGFNFLGDTPVYLLAIHFGATNTELGYISSVIFFAGVLLSVVPRIFAGKNMIQLQYISWLIRGLVCLAYGALFFLKGRSAVWLILGTYTLFCAARIVGAALYQPMIKMISTNRNRGAILSASSIYFQLATSVSRIISFGVTSIKQLTGITGIIILEFFGVILNSLSALEMRKIPCRQTIQYTPGRNVFVIFKEALKVGELRYSILLAWLNTALLVLFGFIIPLLRREGGFSNSTIFLFSLIAGLATISSAFFSKNFADRIGSRPLLLGSTALLGLNFLLWSLSSKSTPLAVYMVFGFLTTFFLRTNDLLINRIIVRSLPEEDSVGYSSMNNFFLAFVALLVGFLGGILADFSQTTRNLPVFNGYTFTFLLALVICVFSLILTLKIRDRGSLSPREAASILFSLTNLNTYQSIGRLSSTTNPMERQNLLIKIGMNNSWMATEEIRSVLFKPLSNDKGQLITSLFSNPRPELLPDLLREAAEPSSYHRLKAIFALGAYPGNETEKLLLSLLDDTDPPAVSNAAKSLGRIGCLAAAEKIKDLSTRATVIWDHLNFIIALKNLDKTGEFLSRVFEEQKTAQSSIFNQTVYSLYSQLLEMQPPLTDIFQSRNMKKGQGLRDFLDEARDDDLFLRNHDDFLLWFREDDYTAIWKRGKEILIDRHVPPYYQPLKDSLMNFPGIKSSYDDALAAVYFTYQLRKLEG